MAAGLPSTMRLTPLISRSLPSWEMSEHGTSARALLRVFPLDAGTESWTQTTENAAYDRQDDNAQIIQNVLRCLGNSLRIPGVASLAYPHMSGAHQTNRPPEGGVIWLLAQDCRVGFGHALR